ncbi:hypothetical protein CC80DRAFT_437970 [Byssothecium circinans]|uniref:Zn(2)-C6 fungal-type domain-containing protein n=1 Tax=Byssothecium circinans TaxID=147558 RepID=A0A6A5UAB1_9PLEO|nr:hypothetical protein CC80DRAFT_437970 [Byssothecium circinans]
MDRDTRPRQRRRVRVVPEGARVRASRACTSCRRLKEKCDGNQPCARCRRTKRTCEFTTAEAHPPPAKAEDFERVRLLEQLAVHFLGPVSLDTSSLRHIIDRIGKKPGDNSNDFELSIENELNDLTLEEEHDAVKLISPSTAHYSGDFSHWRFSQRVRRLVDEHLDGIHPSNESVDKAREMQVLEYWRATQLQSTGSHVLNTLDYLPTRRVANNYFQYYFQYAQTNTFFVDPIWLRTKLDILYTQPTHLNTADSPWVCTVLMVLATGFQFAHMAEGSFTAPLLYATSEEDQLQNRDASRVFYRMSTMLVPDIITSASMESVQACLLLAHYTLPLDTHGLAYTYLGLAMKLAIQNGMHCKYAGGDLDQWTIEMRNRLWWSTYSLERRISVLHGRPTSIVPSEMDADLPQDIDILQSIEYPFSFQNALTLIHMTNDLSDVSQAITKLTRCPKSLQSTHFRNVLDKHEKFYVSWKAALETVGDPLHSLPSPRARVHLKLYFNIFEIFIGRPFMFTNTKQSHLAHSNSQDQFPSSQRASTRALLVDTAIKAAHQAIELLHNLNQSTGLARASYIEFSACRAALLILLAQSLNEQSAQLNTTIALGMGLIRLMVSGNIQSAKAEVSVIEALEEAICRLHARRKSHDHNGLVSVQLDHSQEQNNYVQFEDWTSLWDDLGRGMTQNFPGDDFAISLQLSALPESTAWSQGNNAAGITDAYSFSSFPDIENATFSSFS